MYFSVISFQEFLNFPIRAFSENVQCFVGVFLYKRAVKTFNNTIIALRNVIKQF